MAANPNAADARARVSCDAEHTERAADPRRIARRGRRSGRPYGLAAQHLTTTRALAAVCSARLLGDALGSSYLEFTPTHELRAGAYEIDIGAARAGGDRHHARAAHRRGPRRRRGRKVTGIISYVDVFEPSPVSSSHCGSPAKLAGPAELMGRWVRWLANGSAPAGTQAAKDVLVPRAGKRVVVARYLRPHLARNVKLPGPRRTPCSAKRS